MATQRCRALAPAQPATVIHNFLRQLPPLVGWVDEALTQHLQGLRDWTIFIRLSAIVVIGLLSRLPGIGVWLREMGLPLLTMLSLILMLTFVRAVQFASAAGGAIMESSAVQGVFISQ